MQFIEQEISGVWVIEPQVHLDQRGYFMEAFKQADFEKNIGKVHFIQDNESKSTFGVLRGMHAQAGDAAQAKLVRVLVGKVLDVVVDARKALLHFGKYVAVELSAENKNNCLYPGDFFTVFWS
jgi:dTDP-4-dehydrorhamnose 3,5-epimerase (EC 5.1.3.13)